MSNTNYPRQLQAAWAEYRPLPQTARTHTGGTCRPDIDEPDTSEQSEAPGKITSISLEKLFTIADVLNVSPASLLSFD